MQHRCVIMKQTRDVQNLFNAAMELSPDEQAAFLGQECGSDVRLKARLQAMLAAAARPTAHYLKKPRRQGPPDHDTIVSQAPDCPGLLGGGTVRGDDIDVIAEQRVQPEPCIAAG